MENCADWYITLFLKMKKDISESLWIEESCFVPCSLHRVSYPYIMSSMFARTKIYDSATGLQNVLHFSFAATYHNVSAMTA